MARSVTTTPLDSHLKRLFIWLFVAVLVAVIVAAVAGELPLGELPRPPER